MARRALILAVSALLAFVATASASTWLEPDVHATPPGFVKAYNVRTAMNARGDAVVVYQVRLGPPTDSIDEELFAAFRPAGSPWEDPVMIAGQDAFADGVEVAIDDSGEVIVGWEGGGSIEAQFRTATGVWTGLRQIERGGASAAVAIRDGTALLAYGSLTAGTVHWTRVTSDGFTPPAELPVPDGTASQPLYGAGWPRVALAADGNGVISELVASAAAGATLAASYVPKGAAADPTIVVSGYGAVTQSSHDVVVLSDGRPLVVWAEGTRLGSAVFAPPPGRATWTRISTGVAFDSARTWNLGTADDNEGIQKVLVADGHGDAAVAFTARATAAGPDRVGIATFRGSAVEPWLATPPDMTLDDGYLPSSAPTLGGDAEGALVASWLESDSTNQVAVARVRLAADNSFGGRVQISAPLPVTAALAPPTVGMDAAGDGITGFNDGGVSTTSLEDGAGPVLGRPTIPAAGTTVDDLAFAVTPLDVVSAVVSSPTWTFGDGATASGAIVSHRFARPGTYHVVVAVADPFGAPTTADGTVTISWPSLSVFGGFTGGWHESQLTGAIELTGTSPVAGTLAVALRPGPQWLVTLPEGPFQRRLPITRRLTPGAHAITFSGRYSIEGPLSVSIPLPPEGVVDGAGIWYRQSRQSAATLSGPRPVLWAWFHFVVAPRNRASIRAWLYSPGRPPRPGPPTWTSAAWVSFPGLRLGVYRVVLRSGSVVIARAQVRLTR